MNKVNAQKPTSEFNKIMLIGEAPGAQEEKLGVPFVGMAGRILDDILGEVGIKREECYITNVYKYKPHNNVFSSIDSNALAEAISDLKEEISVVQPNVIVTLGENALKAVTGYRGIAKWRGSILSIPQGKVIPTIHPAAIGREWNYRPLVVCDFKRVREQSGTHERRLDKRELITRPTYEQVIDILTRLKKSKYKVAFDIEVETQQISCISFAISPVNSMCIPFWFGASGSLWPAAQEAQLWKLIKDVLEDASIPKIAQNAQYDMTILRDLYGIRVKGLWLDTMIAFHSVYPELPKGLALLTSLYTDVPYYKDKLYTKNMYEFFEYNAMDAAVTYEVAMKVYEEMKEAGVVEFYNEHMHSLIQPLLDITSIGVRIDTIIKKSTIKEYREILKQLEIKLSSQVGHELNVNSDKQMFEWLYKELKLKPQYRLRKATGKKTLTADEEALEVLFSASQNEAIRTILDIREKRKIISTYLEVKYDKKEGEERARTSYNIAGTETGRLSSSKTVYNTGTNLQNIPKGIVRRMFIPDKGKVFLNADLSQAEARVVAFLAEESRLIKVFTDGGNIYRKTAANIFGKPEQEVTTIGVTSEREIAKKIIHASHYGMGPGTFGKTAGVTFKEAKRLLNAYFAEYPRIKQWHLSIAATLRSSRTLITPLGRKRTFFNRWGPALLKEAYAYIPQSTVADILNMGLRRVYERYINEDVDILLQIHDAILLQVPREQVDTVAKEVKGLLSIPILVNHRECRIPVDVMVGENWDDLKKL